MKRSNLPKQLLPERIFQFQLLLFLFIPSGFTLNYMSVMYGYVHIRTGT